MPQSMLPFLACEPSSRCSEVGSPDDGSVEVVLGKPQARELYEANSASIEAAHRSSKTTLTLIPVGEFENSLWENSPPQLATLVDFPLESAVIVVSVDRLREDSGKSLWQWLAENSGELGVVSIDIEPVAIKESYPDLVPPGSTMPDWLRTSCTSLNLDQANTGPDSIAIKAGLFQIHDELDISHDYSQDCQGEGRYAAGDYWHGIMHRREPDYGNSKYWFRRVGEHPVFEELSAQASGILQCCDSPIADQWCDRLTGSGWDPFAFVDLCESCARTRDKNLVESAKRIQWAEMLLLLAQTYRDAR